jgi:hypothetical protein
VPKAQVSVDADSRVDEKHRRLRRRGGLLWDLKGSPATFKFFHLPLRLDWLYLKQLTPLDWNVDTIPLTDHRGVWARVSL